MSLYFPNLQEFSPIFRLADELNQATRSSGIANSNWRSFAPRFDVKETKDGYELQGELPGIEQSNINIEWSDDNTLTISGHTEHRSERRSGGTIEAVEDEKSVAADEQQQSTEVTATNGAKDVTKQENSDSPRYWVTERSVGSFTRTFHCPGPIDHDKVQASLKNGILSVTVPKTTAKQPRKITISS